MDFNTGSNGGRPDGESRPLYGGEAGGLTRGLMHGPAGSRGIEFDFRDPISTFVPIVLSVLGQPVTFFRGIIRQGDFLNPLIFALICALISSIFIGLFDLILASPGYTGGPFHDQTEGRRYCGDPCSGGNLPGLCLFVLLFATI